MFELLAVILIISLLVLIGLPTFSKFGANTRLKSAASQVASLLRMARNMATANNIAYTVSIYPRNTAMPNQIYITKSGTQVEKIWVAAPLIEIPDVSGDHGAVQTIQFTAYGTATGKSIHIIQKGTLMNGSPYDPDQNYASAARSERVKCATVTTDNNTGTATLYNYGRNPPWASTDL